MTKASLQAAPTASATPTAHAMTVAATAVIDAIRRRQRDFLADPRSVLDRPVLADTTDPVVAAFVVAYDEAVETLGECTPDHPRCAARGAFRRSCSGIRCVPCRSARPPVGQTWHLPESARTPGRAWVGPDRGSSHQSGTRRARLASAGGDPALPRAAQLAEEVGIRVPDLLTPAWQALLDEPKTVAQHCSDRPDPVRAAGLMRQLTTCY